MHYTNKTSKLICKKLEKKIIITKLKKKRVSNQPVCGT
jgi:hypothetical protein